MKRQTGKLPSLTSRVAVRFALVFMIQVMVLGILVLVSPRFMAAVGDLLVESRRAMVTSTLEREAPYLAERAWHYARVRPGTLSPLSQEMASLAAEGRLMLLRGDGSLVSLRPGSPWPATLTVELLQHLNRTQRDGRAWAYLHYGTGLYAIGGAIAPEGEGPRDWLILMRDMAQPLADLAPELGASGGLGVRSDVDLTAPYLSYTSFMGGYVDVAVPVPEAVAADGVVVQFLVPIVGLSHITRAGALIFGASFLILAASLFLAVTSTYSQVARPFRESLAALDQYARTGSWRPPADRYLEQQAVNEAIGEAVLARERAESAARQHMAELRAFIDNLPAQAVVKDTDLRVRLANVAYARRVGKQPEELTGKTDAELFPPEVAQEYKAHDLEVLSQKRALHFEEESQASGERRFYRVVKAPIINETGQVDGLVAVAIDITEQRRVTELLAEARKMEVVGRLAGGLAHAFNNLLTTIIGSAELAMLSLDPDHPAVQDVQQVRDAAEHGGELSRQLLTLSRQRLARTAPTDVNVLIEELVPLLRETLGPAVAITTDLAPNVPHVSSDATQLKQVILNLAINAGEAMPSGGFLHIETYQCRAPREATALDPMLAERPVLCLSMKDTGEGIPEEVKGHVFEPFYTTKGVSQGRGLGLPVVYSIVRQHHGAILFESEPGKGTRFTVFLPGVESEPVDEVPVVTPSEDAPRGQEVILLVEDDALVRQLAARMLLAQGYSLWTAGDGEEALALLAKQAEPPDLLLSDVRMPGMSGLDLARAVRQQYPEVRILLMSGYAGENEEETMGGFPIIWKPFTLQALAQRVRDILDAPPEADARD